METIVYVDVLLVINYVISMALILCSATWMGRDIRRLRLVVSSLTGAIGALTIFLPYMGPVLSICLKFVLSSAMVLQAFGYKNLKQYLKELFAFFAVNFLFAGVMLAIWIAITPAGMIYHNGIVYFDISAFSLLLSTAIAYLVLSLFNRVLRNSRLTNSIWRVTIFLKGKTVTLQGLVDTGNRLTEPFSGDPVIVCALSDIGQILSPKTIEAVQRRGFSDDVSASDIGETALRWIPYSDVTGSGLLPAFKADKLLLSKGKESYAVERAYVAVSAKSLKHSNYNAILSSELIRVKI